MDPGLYRIGKNMKHVTKKMQPVTTPKDSGLYINALNKIYLKFSINLKNLNQTNEKYDLQFWFGCFVNINTRYIST